VQIQPPIRDLEALLNSARSTAGWLRERGTSLRDCVYRRPKCSKQTSGQDGLPLLSQTWSQVKGNCALRTFLIVAIVLPLSVANGAERVIKGPNGLSINCADFHKWPNGTWQSSPDATLTYPERPGSFANNRFSENAINIGGVDVAVFLNQHCQESQF